MNLKVIKTKEDYNYALKNYELLLDKNPEEATEDFNNLEILGILISKYEDENYKIDLPDPIEAIKFIMEQRNLSQRDLIPMLGSRVKVSEVLNKKRQLTLKMIRSLNSNLDIPAEILLKDEKAKLSSDLNGFDYEKDFPISEMLKRNMSELFGKKLSEIKECAEEIIKPIVKYVCDKQNIKFEYKQNIRKSSEIDQNSLIIWKYLVIKKVESNVLKEKYNFNKIDNNFFKKLIEMSSLPNAPKMAKEYLENFGIYLIIEKHFKKTHLDGASFFINNYPVIALTLRYDRIDNFWFVLFHELAHIKLHLSNSNDNEEFIDDLDKLDDSKKELEADDFACNMIINNNKWQKIKDEILTNRINIHDYSKMINIHPAIIAGRIRKETNNYRLYAKIITENKVKYLFDTI